MSHCVGVAANRDGTIAGRDGVIVHVNVNQKINVFVAVVLHNDCEEKLFCVC